MKKKVLLLNPPWNGNNLIRGGYCGHTSKGDYMWPPLDLLLVSGIIASKHDATFVDCIIDKIDYDACSSLVEDLKPDVVLALTSAISFKEDMGFLKDLKKRCDFKLVLSGENPYFEYGRVMAEYKFVDAIIFDFTSDFVLSYICSEFKNLKDIVYRRGDKVIVTGRSGIKKTDLPTPRHDLMHFKKYSFPFVYHNPVAFTVTAYGCPYSCSFCPAGKIPYKERTVESVIKELKFIKKLGIREVNFKDYTMNGNKEHCMSICKEMTRNNLGIRWSCELTVANCDEKLLNVMKKAGCHFVLVGVESANNEILKGVRKPLTSDKSFQFFKMCKKVGIRTLGHFILGLPNDTEETINQTIEFSKKVGCDYASFNLYVPRIGTDLRDDLIKKGKIRKQDLDRLDCSVECIETNLSRDDLFRLKNKAIREFYFRPSQMFKQVFLIRSLTQLNALFKNGCQIVSDYLIRTR